MNTSIKPVTATVNNQISGTSDSIVLNTKMIQDKPNKNVTTNQMHLDIMYFSLQN